MRFPSTRLSVLPCIPDQDLGTVVNEDGVRVAGDDVARSGRCAADRVVRRVDVDADRDWPARRRRSRRCRCSCPRRRCRSRRVVDLDAVTGVARDDVSRQRRSCRRSCCPWRRCRSRRRRCHWRRAAVPAALVPIRLPATRLSDVDGPGGDLDAVAGVAGDDVARAGRRCRRSCCRGDVDAHAQAVGDRDGPRESVPM